MANTTEFQHKMPEARGPEFVEILTPLGRLLFRNSLKPEWLVGEKGFLDEEGIAVADVTALKIAGLSLRL